MFYDGNWLELQFSGAQLFVVDLYTREDWHKFWRMGWFHWRFWRFCVTVFRLGFVDICEKGDRTSQCSSGPQFLPGNLFLVPGNRGSVGILNIFSPTLYSIFYVGIWDKRLSSFFLCITVVPCVIPVHKDLWAFSTTRWLSALCHDTWDGQAQECNGSSR